METVNEQGCQHREAFGSAQCNKLCDPGHSLCPYHLLLAQAEGTLGVESGKPPQKEKSSAKTYQTPRAYSE